MLRKVKNLGHWVWGWYWVLRCGYPAKSMTVIGVTGTDGKTTTCTLIYEILKAGGIKVGLVSTVAAKIGNEEIDTGLHVTNPGPELLQPLLKKMKGAGITHVVLEVTSHGLDQNRVAGCNFKIGVLTNITHEHLDYHRNMQEYAAAKFKLFKGVEYAVLPTNFKFETLNSKLRINSNIKILNYKKARTKDISQALLGDYNLYNIAAALEVAKILKIDERLSHKVTKEFSGVVGRREEIKMGQKFRVIVDFAHTPNALENIGKQLHEELTNGGKLTTVFGCPGKRDKTKRPLMGKAAKRWADRVIVTADDPRNENLGEIFKQVNIEAERIDDRKEAIKAAFSGAKSGDIVLLAGKGHEKSIAIGDQEIPWSDQEVAKTLLVKMV